MAIPEDKFVMTNKKYKQGLALDEYNGTVSIVNAKHGKENNS